MRLAASLLIAALACVSPALAEKSVSSPSPASKQEKAEKKEKKSEKEDAPSGEMEIPIPIGQDVLGIRIPHYAPDGKLLMVFDAKVARKLDASHIEMEDLKIDAYGEDGKKFYIELPRSIFNLETRILAGNERVLVRRDDFEITGDAGEFQTKTRFAKIIGNVKMTIFTTETLE